MSLNEWVVLCLTCGLLLFACKRTERSAETPDAGPVDTDVFTETDIDPVSTVDGGIVSDLDCADYVALMESECPSTDQREPDECVFFVDGTAPEGGDGASWQTAFDDVQKGIDAAYCVAKTIGSCAVWVREGDYYIYKDSEYDTVRLAPGVQLYGGFSGVEDRFEDRDHVHHVTNFLGTAGPDDSQAVHHVVTGCDDVRLDGFTVAKGQSLQETWLRKDSMGAGMLNLEGSATVANCIFSENQTASPGGAIAQYGGELRITDTTFENNFAVIGGGAIYVEGVTLRVDGCIFSRNISNRFGGAIQSQFSSLTIVGSRFENSEASSTGGALAVEGGTATLEDCVFENNKAMASAGAFLLMNGESSAVRNCYFEGNESYYGGAFIISGTGEHIIENSVFANNSASGSGGGLLIRDHAKLLLQNSTFHGNSADSYGAGILAAFTPEEAPLIANSILWGNTPDQVDTTYEGALSIIYSTVQDGYGGTGNTANDPLLADAQNGDFSLLPGSPCIDAANGDFAPTTDFLGNARVDIDAIANTGAGTPVYADIGAFEYQLTPTQSGR